MKVGDKVKLIHSLKYPNAIATVIGIDKGYCPPITVVIDGDDRLPELAMMYFYEEDLEEVK